MANPVEKLLSHERNALINQLIDLSSEQFTTISSSADLDQYFEGDTDKATFFEEIKKIRNELNNQQNKSLEGNKNNGIIKGASRSIL